MKKRNWIKTTIAMITLIATVLETGFSTVSTLAAEITTEDGIVVNTDAVTEADQDVEADDGLQIEVVKDEDAEPAGTSDDDAEEADDQADVQEDDASYEDAAEEADEFQEEETFEAEDAVEEEDAAEEEPVYEEAPELKNGSLSLTDAGITGSGYKEISVYVDTEELAKKDTFRIEFTGPASASYNPIINEELDKTNGGRYDFEGLEGNEFTVRASASDDVILSYKYNEDGYPTIEVASKPKEGTLETKVVTTVDDERFSAVAGEGFDSVDIRFATDKLSGKAKFSLFVESDADATVDGKDVKDGISGLTSKTDSLTIEGLEGESFTAYVKADGDAKIESVADVSDGAAFEVSDVAEKRIYEYEDNDVYVMATLERADAIPDDAEFVVTKITADTEGYNYEAYMDALNENAEEILGEEDATIEEGDALLYDIAFYAKDENGNKIELQPEEGSVKINIEFKKNQLEEDIAAADDEDVVIVHLPLNDDVKDAVDTTADATEIEASDIKVEIVENDTSVTEGSTEFELSDFSVVTLVSKKLSKGQMNPGTPRTFKDILGAGVGYGIVGNDVTFKGHLESTVAVGSLHATTSDALQAPKNGGTQHSHSGKSIIGSFDGAFKNGTGYKLDGRDNNLSDHYVYTTPSAAYVNPSLPAGRNDGQLDNEQNQRLRASSGVVLDTKSLSQSEIVGEVSGLVNAIHKVSEDMANEPNSYKYSDCLDSNGVLDIAARGTSDTGTYYIDLDANQFNGLVEGAGKKPKIHLKKGQTVVFNIPDSSVMFHNYFIKIEGVQIKGTYDYVSTGAGEEEDEICQRVVFNCHNASSAKIAGDGSPDGIFLVPHGDFATKYDGGGGPGAGWVVANTISGIGGAEWHCVYHGMEDPRGTSIILHAIKKINGQNPGDKKFKFSLYDFTYNENEQTGTCAASARETVENSGEAVTFKAIPYAKDLITVDGDTRTFWYAIVENEVDDDGYDLDPKVAYAVKVVVKKNGLKLDIASKKVYEYNLESGAVSELSDAIKALSAGKSGDIESATDTAAVFNNIPEGEPVNDPAEYEFKVKKTLYKGNTGTEEYKKAWPCDFEFTLEYEPYDEVGGVESNAKYIKMPTSYPSYVTKKNGVYTVKINSASDKEKSFGSIKFDAKSEFDAAKASGNWNKVYPNDERYGSEQWATKNYIYNILRPHMSSDEWNRGEVRYHVYKYKITEKIGDTPGVQYCVLDDRENETKYNANKSTNNGHDLYNVRYIKLTLNVIKIGNSYRFISYIQDDGSGNGLVVWPRYRDPNRTYPQIEGDTQYCEAWERQPIEFFNRYWKEGEKTIPGLKTINNGQIAPKDRQFEFYLTSDDDKNSSRNNLGPVYNNAQAGFSFGPLKYTLDDLNDNGEAIYTYDLKETNLGEPGMSYTGDKVIKVKVKDDPSKAALDVRLLREDGTPYRDGEDDTVIVDNEFDTKTDITFKAHKAAKKGENISGKDFIIELYENSLSGSPKETRTVTGVGNVSFTPIEYTRSDAKQGKSFEYYIKESDVDENGQPIPGVEYDPTVYHIKVTLSLVDSIVDGKKIEAIKKTVYLRNDGESFTGDEKPLYDDVNVSFKNDDVIFTNGYKVLDGETVIAGYKNLIGKTLENHEFTFILTPVGNTATAVKEGKVILPKTEQSLIDRDGADAWAGKCGVTNVGNYFYFGTDNDKIRFTEEGDHDYVFEIREEGEKVYDDEGNLVYEPDPSVYEVTIHVVEGTATVGGKTVVKLNADKKTWKKDGKDYTVTGNLPIASFTNRYYGKGKIQFFAKKELNGKVPGPDEKFTFILYDMTSGQPVEIDRQENDADGLVTFKEIPYKYSQFKALDTDNDDKVTYKYAIEEEFDRSKAKRIDNTDYYLLNGYTYDGRTENITVEVTLQTDLKLKPVITEGNATLTVPALFNNKYEEKGSGPIEGGKHLTGRAFKDDDHFYADLYVKGTFNPAKIDEGRLQSVEITKTQNFFANLLGLKVYEGTFKFKDIQYTKPGTYYYEVRESGSGNEVVNDGDVYYVTHNVTNDKHDGTLDVAVTYSDKNGKTLGDKGLVFNNVYVKGGAVFKAKKVLENGGKIEDGKFKFTFAEIAADGKEKNPETITVPDSSVVMFSAKEYTMDDALNNKTFTYKIYEQPGSVKGYSYDKSFYTITVTLGIDTEKAEIVPTATYVKTYYEPQMDANGNPLVDEDGKVVTVEKKTASAAVPTDGTFEFVFKNTYDAEGDIEFPVKKELIGAQLKKDMFEFELYDENWNLIGTEKNPDPDENGESVAWFTAAKYPALHYTQADLTADSKVDNTKDIYRKFYYIKEKVDGGKLIGTPSAARYEKDGFIYDGRTYKIAVKLQDKGGYIDTDYSAEVFGQKTEEPSILQKLIAFLTGNDPTKNIIFKNEFRAKGSVTFDALKLLDGKGRKLDGGEFTFILNGIDEVETDPAESIIYTDSVTNDADGKVSFKKIDFTNDMFGSTAPDANGWRSIRLCYEISEFIPPEIQKNAQGKYVSNDGITYDDTVYRIYVTVTDKNTGVLEVSASTSADPKVAPFATSDANGACVASVRNLMDTSYTFKNLYECEPVEVRVGGLKVLTGRDLEKNEFSFKMWNDAENGNNKTYSDEKGNNHYYDPSAGKLKDDEQNTLLYDRFVFEPIRFTIDDLAVVDTDGKITGYDKSREFKYIIQEQKGTDTSIEYDTKKYSVTVVVKNTGSKLTASLAAGDDIIIEADGTITLKDAVTITNHYVAAGELVLNVGKKVENNEDDRKFFRFFMEGTKLPADKIVKLDGHDVLMATASQFENGSFAKIKYELGDLTKKTDGTYEGKFSYTVREIDENASKPADEHDAYVYSKEVYSVEVTVTADGTSKVMKIDKKFTKDGKPYDYDENGSVMLFKNTYHASAKADVDGKKVFPGGNISAGDFTFILSKKGDDGKYAQIGTTTNDAAGKYSFHLGDYTEMDRGMTYEYMVTEDDSKKLTDVIYDDSYYVIEIANIRDSGKNDGKLIYDRTITRKKKGEQDQPAETCLFNNIPAIPNSITFIAHKTLTGIPLKGSEFNFKITENGKLYDEQKNTTGGLVTFKTRTYKLEDAGKTFTYVITEEGKSAYKNIKYSTIEYKAVVNVTSDSITGDINIDTKIYKDGTEVSLADALSAADPDAITVTDADTGVIVDNLNFVNEPESEVTVSFNGEKKLVGFDKVSALGTYTFTLKEEGGTYSDEVTVTPTKATDPVAINFKPITYTKADYDRSAANNHIITYDVEEKWPNVSGKDGHISYATEKYKIHVELYYDQDDFQLKYRDWESIHKVDPEKDLNFTNVFAGDNEIVFTGEKTITGIDLGKFEFTLVGDGQNQKVENYGSAITFDPIKYDQTMIGDHEYLISEVAYTKAGYKYDEHVYKAVVTVGDGVDKDGKLPISKKITRMKPDPDNAGQYIPDPQPEKYVNDDGDMIIFNNEYKASNHIEVAGIKKMHRKPLKAGDYTFVLKDENGNELKTVTHGDAALGSDRWATAAFEFTYKATDDNGQPNPNYVKEFNYTQDDLLSADGKSYLKEIWRYYTIDEVYQNPKGGVTYSDAAYVITVHIEREDGSDVLKITKEITETTEDKATTLLDSIKNAVSKLSGVSKDIVFVNEYYSECPIDPPVLTKEIMGREILPGEFTFEIKGTPFQKMPNPGSEYVDVAYNDEKGEIDVSNIHLTIDDLDLQSDGSFSKEFVYTATEIDPKQPGMIKSPAMYELRFIAYDDGNGKMYTVPPEKAPEGKPKLEWKQISPNGLEREADFVNIFNWEGSVDIRGIKKMDGRKLKDDDRFEFTITEVGKPDNTYSVVNKREKVDFLANDVVGKNGNHFLKYRYGGFEDTPNVLTAYDDRGSHVYEIVEKAFNKQGVTRDPSVFEVHVDVTEVFDEYGNPVIENGHGKLSATVTDVFQIKDKIKEPFPYDSAIQFEFTNEFRATGSVDLNGIKFLKDMEGKDYKSEKSLLGQFEFALHQYSNDARTLGKTLIDSKKSSATDGSFAFDTLSFDQEVLKNRKGEYDSTKTLYYRVTEIKPSGGKWNEDKTQFESEGIVFDLVEYDVDVVITLVDGSTQLKVEKIVKNAANKASVAPTTKDGKSYDVSFTNKVREYTIVEGTKYWIDNIKDPNDRPDLKIILYSVTASKVTTKINEYTLKAPNTEYVFMTDSKGNKLPTCDSAGRPITYEVEEEPIEGYLSEKVNYDFYNTKGDVLIRKIDADTRTTLAGATLAILDGSTEIERWTSGSSAHVVSAALTAGKTYTLREIEAPAGYGKAADMTFTVPKDGKEITVTMSDPKILGSVRLTKRDATTREVLAGAEFALYNDAGARIYATGTAGSYRATDSTSNGVFVTDTSGTLTISDLPYGTYYFVETKAPAGYALSSDRMGFTILKQGELVEVTYLDPKSVGSVRLLKVGESGTRALAGAVFELYAATPRSVGQAAASTLFSNAYYRYGTYRTNASGEIFVDNLPWDSYYFVEVDAPSGYEVNKDVNGDDIVYTFTISAASADATIDLGRIINTPPTPPPPPRERYTPTPTPIVERGGVVSGVLGVRAKPTSGVLGERIGPVTGDASNIILWLLLLTACVATIVATVVTGKKKKAAAK